MCRACCSLGQQRQLPLAVGWPGTSAPNTGIQPSEGLWQAGGTAFVWSITTWNHLEPPLGRMGGFSKQGSVER